MLTEEKNINVEEQVVAYCKDNIINKDIFWLNFYYLLF